MRTIWKYAFAITDEFQLEMPQGARIITAQAQNGVPCLWAAVDPSQPKELRRFYVVGTGGPLQDHCGAFVATLQMGPFVWHLFQDQER